MLYNKKSKNSGMNFEINMVMKVKIIIILVITGGAWGGWAQNLEEAINLLRQFQYQQLNYCYQEFFRIGGLYKSSPYVQEADIATTGFALAGLAVACENNLVSVGKAKDLALETVNTCIKLQHDPRQNYLGFLYHYYIWNEFTETLDHKPGVEVSTIDTALLLAGMITISEYLNSKGFPELREQVKRFYSQINWKAFFDDTQGYFHMAWRGKFFGYWDFYSDEILLIAILAQGSPNPEYRVEIRDVLRNIKVKKDNYGDLEYVYSWYGSLFTYLFAHAFVDFRRVGKDIIYNVDWWENTKNAILADIRYCEEKGYPDDIWGLSACWSRISPHSNQMEYRARIGGGLSGAIDEWERIDNDKNGVKPVAPYAAIGALPFFEELPLTQNPAFRFFAKVHKKIVDRSGLLIESLDAGRIGPDGLPEVNSHWLVGMDIVFPALMIENYFTNLVWDNFMSNFYIQYSLLKVFPAYYTYIARK
jgi:hypothetical protein